MSPYRPPLLSRARVLNFTPVGLGGNGMAVGVGFGVGRGVATTGVGVGVTVRAGDAVASAA